MIGNSISHVVSIDCNTRSFTVPDKCIYSTMLVTTKLTIFKTSLSPSNGVSFKRPKTALSRVFMLH